MSTQTLVFFDADVLLASFDDTHLDQQRRSREWLTAGWQRRCGRLSTQVLNDFYAQARRCFATAISAGDARAEVRRYQLWRPWQIDQATVDTAWAAESRYQIDYSDALLVAAAQHQGCKLLLTEALPHNLIIDTLRIVNPFLADPGLLEASA